LALHACSYSLHLFTTVKISAFFELLSFRKVLQKTKCVRKTRTRRDTLDSFKWIFSELVLGDAGPHNRNSFLSQHRAFFVKLSRAPHRQKRHETPILKLLVLSSISPRVRLDGVFRMIDLFRTTYRNLPSFMMLFFVSTISIVALG
jgi:hypothetical protein